MLLPPSAPPATAEPQASEIDGIRLLQLSGCSRLCVVLGGLGIAFSLGAATATHQLLHEPLESVAAASSLHMAAAFCTANDAVLTRLALAESATLSRNHGVRAARGPQASAERDTPHRDTGHNGHATPQASSPMQVTTLAVDGRADRLLQSPPSTLVPVLSQIGLISLLGSSTPPSGNSPTSATPRPGRGRGPRSRATPCADHGLEEIRQRTRVFRLPPPAGTTTSNPRLLYAMGPWSTPGGQRRLVVATTDLEKLVASVGELDAHNHAGANDHRTPLMIRSDLVEHSRGSGDSSDDVDPGMGDTGLSGGDQKLSNARRMGFANSDLTTLVTVDHHAIDRTSRRAAALAFVMGLSTTMIVVLISRYSQLKLLHLNRALRRESRTDGLTKLANRRAWDEALMRADQLRQRQADTYAVVVIDLDGFKQINDSQGHHQGDQVLIQAAEALRREVREADLAARLGGDEFGILLVNPSQEGLNECVDRLRTALGSLSIKASIGASLSQPNTSLELTWAEADGSMYQVKRS